MKKEQFSVFVVEDDPFYGSMLEYHLTLNPDYTVERFETGRKLLDNLHKRPSVITLDYSLPDIDGERLLRQIRKQQPNVPVIIISGQEDVATAVELVKIGAYDYIVKDDNAKDRLWNALTKVRETIQLREKIDRLRQEVQEKYDFENIIKGSRQALQRVFSLMEKAVKTTITVSIHGETGTGKELVAKAIHYNSDRKNQPFVAVNVAAIPRELVESELFGHEKGAFTGAMNRRIGRFEEAHQGTLFLDEIAEMDLPMQAKLLRVLQEQEVTRIGSNQPVKIDFRLVVATHKNLLDAVRKGNFRQDLYYRLLGLTIELPPLRERGSDILILTRHFIDEFCRKNRLDALTLSTEASHKLLNYSYPGNVRELRAIIELACVMASGRVIEASDITFNSLHPANELLMEEVSLRTYTRRIIRHYLNKYDNDVLLVAEKLDIGKSTIYKMLKEGEL